MLTLIARIVVSSVIFFFVSASFMRVCDRYLSDVLRSDQTPERKREIRTAITALYFATMIFFVYCLTNFISK